MLSAYVTGVAQPVYEKSRLRKVGFTKSYVYEKLCLRKVETRNGHQDRNLIREWSKFRFLFE